jgi:hypothetical protein
LTYLSGKIKEPLKGEFLFQNSGLSIFLSLFERVIAYDGAIPTEGRLQTLLSPFLNHLNSEYATTAEIHALKIRCNSEGGRDEVTDDFVIEMNELTNESLPVSGRIAVDLGKRLSVLERNLREVLRNVLSKHDPDWIKSRTVGTTFTDLREKHRDAVDLMEFLSLGQCVDTIIKRDDNWSLFKGLFLDVRVGFDNKESLAVALNQIVSTRNSIIHGRPLKWKLGDRAILDANMAKLGKIVENTIAVTRIDEVKSA